MKNSKKSVMHVLGMSILLAWSSTSFAELVVHNSPVASGTNGSASLNWSANDASQLMEEDEPLEISPQGSTSVTTTLRSGGSATITSSSNPKILYKFATLLATVSIIVASLQSMPALRW